MTDKSKLISHTHTNNGAIIVFTFSTTDTRSALSRQGFHKISLNARGREYGELESEAFRLMTAWERGHNARVGC